MKPKKIQIRNWEHAINLTISRHAAVIKKIFPKYTVAKGEMKPENWTYDCPLCEHTKNLSKKTKVSRSFCQQCLWIKFEGRKCEPIDFMNDFNSIKRLRQWKRMLIAKQNGVGNVQK